MKNASAIKLVHQTGFGLTSGLESLDDREQAEWKAGIKAGNLYINRSTVGAVVLRQPFGGMGKSAFGPGLKAGGPNYVAQFMQFTEAAPADSAPVIPADSEAGRLLRELNQMDAPTRHRLAVAMAQYQAAWTTEFSLAHDHFKLIGQDNLRRYLPVRELRIRVHEADSPFDLVGRIAAARTVGSRITVSAPPGLNSPLLEQLPPATEDWAAGIEFIIETDGELAAALRQHATDRVRYASADRVPLVVRRAAAETQIYVADQPVLATGRVELLWYLQEQSLSFDYHRYGNLGTRSGEPRAPLTQPDPSR